MKRPVDYPGIRGLWFQLQTHTYCISVRIVVSHIFDNIQLWHHKCPIMYHCDIVQFQKYCIVTYCHIPFFSKSHCNNSATYVLCFFFVFFNVCYKYLDCYAYNFGFTHMSSGIRTVWFTRREGICLFICL